MACFVTPSINDGTIVYAVVVSDTTRAITI